MQLKKILAVALAATTALSSGVAYDMLGASAKTAEAAQSGTFFSAGESFNVTSGSVTYTLKVAKPILNGFVEGNGNVTTIGDGATKASNALYSNGEADVSYKLPVDTGSATTVYANAEGLVTLTGISLGDGFTGSNVDIPEYVEKAGNSDLSTVNWNGTTNTSVKGKYYITEVDLDGENVTDQKKIETFTLKADPAKHIGSFKAEDFEALSDVKYNGSTAVLDAASTVDVSGTNLGAKVSTLFGTDKKLETLDISSLKNKPQHLQISITSCGANANIKSINVSENEGVELLELNNTVKEVTVNVSNCTGIKTLKASNAALAAANAVDVRAYDAPNYKSIKWITDGSDTASYDLDISFVNGAEDIEINNTGLRSFTAPGFSGNGAAKLDISKNSLTSVSLSSASKAKTVDVSDNKLLDCDVSGLSDAQTIAVDRNYLTSMDTSGLNDGTRPSVTMTGNYIPSDNLTKGDKQTGVSLGSQETAELFKWGFVGDIGEASGSETKAMMKLGGTGTLAAIMIVRGAPDGFAERLASTIKWSESNAAETSAITLGENKVDAAMETGYNLAGIGQGNLSGVMVSTAITANATKTAAEKVTLQYGNTKKDINISNDNVVLVNYDIASAIESDNIKKDNANTIAYASFMFPTEAFILNNAGTVDATLSSNFKPLAKTEKTFPTNTFTEILPEKLRVMEGVTFTKWNTMADGSGTATASGSKLKGVAEDTTVYANYTENTYSISYNSGMKASNSYASVTVSGSTATQTGIKYGEDVTLTSNGFSTSKGNFYGWRMGDEQKFYSDGQTVHGLVAKSKKTESIQMQAFYGDADHYVNAESSISLVVGDAKEGAYLLEDLKPVVTGDPTGTSKDGQSGVDLGFDKNFSKDSTKNFTVLSSNNDVVEIKDDYAIAKGSGTADIYIRDNHYGNLATVTVSVQSKDEAAAAAELKAKQAATNKSIAAGEKTDVSDYSKFAATVVKNADGENTVTVTKGKNVKTAKINTITIGDKTYTVTRIGANAYKGMSKLTTVTTSNKVKVIGKAAFANCKKLTKVTLGKAVVKIGANAFKNDKKLAKILIKSKKLTKKARVGKNSFKGIKATAKFYIAKKAATYKKVKKAIKAQSGAPKKATYVKKYA